MGRVPQLWLRESQPFLWKKAAGLFRGIFYRKLKTIDCGSDDAREKQLRDERNALERLGPPNLQLNHSRPYDAKDENRDRAFTFFVVVIAVILQLGLVAIAGVTAYHAKTGSAVGNEFGSYGFPCYAAGSFCLSLGMGICAFVIGQSTEEWTWTRKSKDEKDDPKSLCLFWVQKAQSVNNQTFGP